MKVAGFGNDPDIAGMAGPDMYRGGMEWLSKNAEPGELIVIDDGSNDYTLEVDTSFANVQYLWQANAGLSAARIAGIARSKGEYLVFLDADDILYPNAVETNLHWLRKEWRLWRWMQPI